MARIVGTTLCLALLTLGFGQSSGQVLINEILADPASDWDGDSTYSYRGDEWVEIYNAGATEVDLSAYWLGDADSTLLYNFSGRLDPGRHRIVYGSEAVEWQRANGHSAVGLRLNNSGDTVMLWEVQGDPLQAAGTVTLVGGTMKSAEVDETASTVQVGSVRGDAVSAVGPSEPREGLTVCTERRTASLGGNNVSPQSRAAPTESSGASEGRIATSARGDAPEAKGNTERLAGQALRPWSGTVLVDSYEYLSHEAEDDRSTGRMPDGGTVWEIFDGLNPYGGSQEPQGNGCLPSPGAQNGCPTPTFEQSWGSVKALYR